MMQEHRLQPELLYFDRYVAVSTTLLLLTLVAVVRVFLVPTSDHSFSPLFAVAVWALPLGIAGSATFKRDSKHPREHFYNFAWHGRMLFWGILVAVVFGTFAFAHDSKFGRLERYRRNPYRPYWTVGAVAARCSFRTSE